MEDPAGPAWGLRSRRALDPFSVIFPKNSRRRSDLVAVDDFLFPMKFFLALLFLRLPIFVFLQTFAEQGGSLVVPLAPLPLLLMSNVSLLCFSFLSTCCRLS